MPTLFSRMAIVLVPCALAVVLSVSGDAFAHPINSIVSQAAPGITVRRSSTTIPNNSEVDLAVTCARGEVATGGGGAVGPGGIAGAYLTTSGPFPSPTAAVMRNPTGWHVIATNTSGTDQPLTVWVLCAS
ncbi:MAG TPA: hypothetical protein VGN34_30210 [Ktedonobacteraceae bacterium]|jgi:hypothetical protein